MKLVANCDIWVNGDFVEAGQTFDMYDNNDIKRIIGDGAAHSFEALDEDEGQDVTVRKGNKK